MTENFELTRKVASDPCTAPDVLAELGGSSDRTTRQYVAANPNTPTEVLLKLGAEFPEELLENPIFSLLLLENPKLPAKIPYNTMMSLLQCEMLPDSFMAWGLYHISNSKLAFLLAMSPKTPKNVLQGLLNSEYHPELKEFVQLHVNFAGEMTESWDSSATEGMRNATLNGQKYGQYLEQLAKINSIPKYLIGNWELFEQILPASETSVKQTDSNRKTPIQGWRHFRANYDDVCQMIANNPKTPVNVLSQLATDDSAEVRRLVANNPNTPANVLSQLATDNYVIVRVHVAGNPNTNVNILSHLAKDNSNVVRLQVAGNPNTNVNILSHLAKDNSNVLRYKVAKNPNTPMWVLEQLLGDSHEGVLKFAVPRYLTQNPDKLSLVLQHYPKDYRPGYSRLVIFFHPQVPTNLLVENSRSDAWLERYAIAQNPNTPPDTLEMLARDLNRIVRAAAKANLNRLTTLHKCD